MSKINKHNLKNKMSKKQQLNLDKLLVESNSTNKIETLTFESTKLVNNNNLSDQMINEIEDQTLVNNNNLSDLEIQPSLESDNKYEKFNIVYETDEDEKEYKFYDAETNPQTKFEGPVVVEAIIHQDKEPSEQFNQPVYIPTKEQIRLGSRAKSCPVWAQRFADEYETEKVLKELEHEELNFFSKPVPILSESVQYYQTWDDTQKNYIKDELQNTSLGEVLNTEELQGQFMSFIDKILTQVPSTGMSPSTVIQLSTSLISSLMSGVLITHSLLTKKTTTAFKITSSLTLTANLLCFASTISEVIRVMRLSGSINKPKQTYQYVSNVVKLITNPDVNDTIISNTSGVNYMKFLKPTLKGIVVLTTGLITGFDPIKIKTLTQLNTMMDFTNKVGKSMDDGLEFITSTVLGLDLTGDDHKVKEIMDLCKEAEALATTPMYRFMQDGVIKRQLTTFYDRATKKLTFHNKETSLAIRTALATLAQNLTYMRDLKRSLDAKSVAKKRQEAQAIMFCGSHGIGKSSLSKHILTYLANELDYQTDIYSLNKPDGFYLPYHGQDLAILDEFACTNTGNKDLAHYNLLFSADPFNLEGAAIEIKEQPCDIKIGGITCNELSPRLSDLKSTSVEALWDRTVRIWVEDPKYVDRCSENAHRKRDFSHLKLYVSTSNSRSLTVRDMTECDLTELKHFLLHTVALKEKNFLEQHIEAFDADEKLKMQARIDNLKNLGYPHKNNDPMESTGQKFFIVRLQGKAGGGKSTLANMMQRTLMNVLPQLKTIILDDFQTIYDGFNLFIIDDLINPNNPNKTYDEYVNWLNKQQRKNPNNIYLIVENVEYRKNHKKYESFFDIFRKTPQAYDLTGIANISGIIRRLGLEGFVKFNNEYVYNEECNNTCATVKGNQWEMNDKLYTPLQLCDIVFEKYRTYITTLQEVVVQYTDKPPRHPFYHIDIHAQGVKHLEKCLSTPNQVFKAIIDKVITIHDEVYTQVSKLTNCSDWLVQCDVKTMQDLIIIAKKLYSTLSTLAPNLTFRIILDKEKMLLIGDRNILYVVNSQKIVKTICQYTTNGGIAVYDVDISMPTSKSLVTIVTPQTFAHYYIDSSLNKMEKLNYEQLLIAKTFYEETKDVDKKAIIINNEIAKVTWLRNSQKYIKSSVFQNIVQHPVMAIIAGSISIIAGGSLVYWLCKKTFGSKTEPETSFKNNQYYGEAGQEKLIKLAKHQQEKFKRDGDYDPDQFCRYLDKRGIRDQFLQYEASFSDPGRTWNTKPSVTQILNSKLTDVNLGIITPKEAMQEAIKTNNMYDMKALLSKDMNLLELVTHTSKNMLTDEDVEWQNKTQLETFRSGYENNFVIIKSKQGTNYGLGYKQRLGITVGHCVTCKGEEFEVQSSGKTYRAIARTIDRRRDLMIFEILDKQFPQFRDITNKFSTTEEAKRAMSAYYVKPAPHNLTVYGSVTYTADLLTPLSFNDPLFHPDQQQMRIRFLQIQDVANCINIGDCGLPLIINVGNVFKIAGVHNSFSLAANSAWFSHVNIDDLNVYATKNTDKQIYENYYADIKHPENGRMLCDKFYFDRMADCEPSKYEQTSKLKVMGYCKQLWTRSNPRASKFKLPSMEGKYVTTCDTTVAALKYEPWMNADNLYKDCKGRPDTLFTQAEKFAQYQLTYGNYDNEVVREVLDLIELRWDQDYPNRKNSLNTHFIINGTEDQHLKGIDLTTSPGPKIKIKYQMSTKHALFENVAPTGKKPYLRFAETPAAQECLEDFKRMKEAMYEGEHIMMVAKDNPKVELISTEKVKQGKVRLFNELDLYANLVLKHFFGNTIYEVIKTHETTPYKIGYNPYKEATIIQMDFDCIQGYVLSLDVKALDKSIPKEIMAYFCNVALSYCEDKTQIAFAKFLTTSMHIIDGTVYFPPKGNESGSYVTTLLNCFCMEFILMYTVREQFEKLHIPFNMTNIRERIRFAVLGDDLIIKVHYSLDINLENIREVSRKFNVEITEAKVLSEGISFCSRTFIKDEITNVVFPALKLESVTSCLHWFNKPDKDIIAQNLNTALFEASLHDRKIFDKVLIDVMKICEIYKLSAQVDLATYREYRRIFLGYVKGTVASPSFMALSNQESELNKNSKTQLVNLSKLYSNIYKIKMAKSQFNEYCTITKQQMVETHFSKVGLDHTPMFICKSLFKENTFKGQGHTKKMAEENMFKQLCATLIEEYNTNNMEQVSNMEGLNKTLKLQSKIVKNNKEHESNQPEKLKSTAQIEYEVFNMIRDMEKEKFFKQQEERYNSRKSDTIDMMKEMKLKMEKPEWLKDLSIVKPFVEATIKKQISIAKNMPGSIYLLLQKEVFDLPTNIEVVDGYRKITRDFKGHKINAVTCEGLQAIDYTVAMELLLEMCIKEKICLIDDNAGAYTLSETPTKNNDTNQPIEPAAANGTMKAVQASRTPTGMSAQVAGVNPAMTAPSEDIMGTFEPTVNHQDLNPLGVPKMMAAGAINFTIQDLVYTTFLDTNTLFTVTNTGAQGAIIAQIPYNPLDTTYMNKYIRAWVGLHERYEGSILARITIIGNPVYSSAIGVSWMPTAVTGNTVDITEAQKYAYRMTGTTQPSNETYILHDARKHSFYRTTDETDIANRPHLLLYLAMPIQNPFGEEAVIRFRIATKLANPGDGANYFSVADPYIAPPASLGLSTGTLGGNLKLFFKQIYNEQMFIYTDGTVVGKQDTIDGFKYPTFTASNLIVSNYTSQQFGINPPTEVNGCTIPMWFNVKKSEEKPFDDWLTDDQDLGNIVFTFYTPNFWLTEEDKLKYFGWWQDLDKAISNPLVTTAEQIEYLIMERILNLQTNDLKFYSIWRYIAPDLDYGGLKIVSNHGIIYISFIKHDQTVPGRPYTGYSSRMLEGGRNWSALNYGNVDSVLLYTNTTYLTAMGPETAVLRITSTPPSANLQGENSPTARDDPIVLAYCSSLAQNLDENEFVRMYLTNVANGRIIAVAQYLKSANCFVINQSTAIADYSVLPVSADAMNIEIRVEKNAVTLPYTDNSTWLSRVPTQIQRKQKKPDIPEDKNALSHLTDKTRWVFQSNEQTQKNASAVLGAAAQGGFPVFNVIGGALSGIGGGLQQNAQNAWNASQSQAFRDQQSKENHLDRLMAKEINEGTWKTRQQMQQRDHIQQSRMQLADANNTAYLQGARAPSQRVAGVRNSVSSI
jgi:hypothetical protein